jgi:hypothetical protein
MSMAKLGRTGKALVRSSAHYHQRTRTPGRSPRSQHGSTGRSLPPYLMLTENQRPPRDRIARGTKSFNPYTPDAGARPPALVGRDRDRELDHLQSIITQLTAGGTERHLLITGLRGVGKTVVLNEFENTCAEAGWSAESKEVARDSSAAVLVGRSASGALRQLSLRAKVTDRLRRAMGVVTSFEVTLPGDAVSSSASTRSSAMPIQVIWRTICAMFSSRRRSRRRSWGRVRPGARRAAQSVLHRRRGADRRLASRQAEDAPGQPGRRRPASHPGFERRGQDLRGANVRPSAPRRPPG